jgi:hypothetical protein
MGKTVADNPNTGMLKEYDFSKGVRGKYAKQSREGTNLVKLDYDVAEMFPDAKPVNDALRAPGQNHPPTRGIPSVKGFDIGAVSAT